MLTQPEKTLALHAKEALEIGGHDPPGAAQSARVVYSTDGTTWRSVPLEFGGQTGNNDWWHVTLGKFPSRATIQYAIEVVDNSGRSWWVSNNGADYRVTVN